MPDPRQLRVGDRIRFVALPDEWSAPGYFVHDESREFLQALIDRGRPSRVRRIDDDGIPWIEARLRADDGTIVHHDWGIREASGWVRL
ncbi:MAG: hypothetical protein KDB80_10175 [Planctomycetes bacterium]|nr:hypothetical protein [Planctomycetota bacterium]